MKSSGKTLEHYEQMGAAVVDRQLGIRLRFLPGAFEWILQRPIEQPKPRPCRHCGSDVGICVSGNDVRCLSCGENFFGSE